MLLLGDVSYLVSYSEVFVVARTAREDEEWSTTVSRTIRVAMFRSFILMLVGR